MNQNLSLNPSLNRRWSLHHNPNPSRCHNPSQNLCLSLNPNHNRNLCPRL